MRACVRSCNGKEKKLTPFFILHRLQAWGQLHRCQIFFPLTKKIRLEEREKQEFLFALNPKMRLRITLVGASASGKSCLIKRYCEKRFVSRYLPTIGIDYGATKIYVDAREVSVHIFDTSGSPLFKEVRNEFYRDAHGILLVFDASSRSSFDALCQWTKEVYATVRHEPL